MRVAASSIRSRYWRALPSRTRSSRRAQPLAKRHDLAQRLLEVVRCDERELVQRRVRSLQLAALNGEESLGEPSLGHVFDRQKNQPRDVRAVRDEPGIQLHDLSADARKDVVDVDVVQLALGEEAVAQQRPKRRDVPLTITQGEEHFTHRVLRCDSKGLKKRPVGVRDAEFGIEQQQRLAHGVDDVQQQAFVWRAAAGGGAGVPSGENFVARHETYRRSRIDRPQ